MKRVALLLVVMLFLSVVIPSETVKVTVPLRFDQYYPLEMVYEALQALHKAYSKQTKLEMVGKSEEDRPIYAMTVNIPKTGEAVDKPGIYVDGNIHGNEIQGGEICPVSYTHLTLPTSDLV